MAPPSNKDRTPRFDWDQDASSVFNDIGSLEKAIDSTRAVLDTVKEKVFSLSAEYTNDKSWVHTTLRDVLATQDKALDRISRLEGKFDNGVNKTIVDMKKDVDTLKSHSSTYASSEDLQKVEKRIDAKKDEIIGLLDKYKDEQSTAITNVDKSRKESWGTALKTIGVIISIIGQVILFVTLVIALIQL